MRHKSLCELNPEPRRGEGSLKPFLVFLLRLGVAAALLVFLFRKVPLAECLRNLRAADLSLWLAALALYFAGQLVSTYRWKVLLTAKGIHASYWELWRLYFIGMFFNAFLPTGLGGDVIRSYDLGTQEGKRAGTFASVVVERGIGLLALVLIGVWSAAWLERSFPGTHSLMILLGILAVGTAAMGFLLHRRFFQNVLGLSPQGPGIWGKIARLQEETSNFLESPGILVRCFWLSVPIQVLSILSVGLVAQSLGLAIPATFLFVFMPIIFAISFSLPVTINGLGVREWLFVSLFSQIGLPQASALSLSLLYFAVLTVGALGGGIIFALRGLRLKTAPVSNP